MSRRDDYPIGVPCWVENLQVDGQAARRFYTRVFGWEWIGPGPTAGDPERPYFVARLHGSDVAGVAPAPDGVPPVWMTHVRVGSAAEAAAQAQAAGGTVLAGPMDLPPVGRLTVLADPTGAGLCAFEPAVRRGAQRINEPSAWAMSVLATPDPERVAPFYREMFGWETEPFEGVQLYRLPGFIGGEPSQPVPRDVVAGMVPSNGGAPASWQVDFWVADAEAAAAAARDGGGTVVVAVHEAPPFRRAILADPGGATFAVSQLVRSR
jgi:predicted enzyme related to lactoylglutathione lyase